MTGILKPSSIFKILNNVPVVNCSKREWCLKEKKQLRVKQAVQGVKGSQTLDMDSSFLCCECSHRNHQSARLTMLALAITAELNGYTGVSTSHSNYAC